MLLYKNVPFGFVDTKTNRTVTILNGIYEGIDFGSQVKFTIANTEDSNGIPFTLGCEGTPLDKLVDSLHVIFGPDSIVKTSLLSTLSKLAKTLGTDEASLLDALKDAKFVVEVLTGTAKPVKKLPNVSNLFVNKIVNLINKKYFETAVFRQTLKMENPESEVVLSLSRPNEILLGDYTLPNLNNLFDTDLDLGTIHWRRVVQSKGIPDSYVIGNSDNDKVAFYDNEIKVREQLLSLFYALCELELGKGKDSPDILTLRPKSFVSYMEGLIYLSLRKNWLHTGVVVLKQAFTDMMEDSDYDDDDDDEGTGSGDEMQISDGYYDVDESEMSEIRIRFKRLDVNTLPDATTEVINFIKYIEGKHPDINNYIEAFIKLLRWGSRKVSRLYLGKVRDTYLNLEYFRVQEDLSEDQLVVKVQHGCGFMPTQILYYQTTPNVNMKEMFNMENTMDFFVPGIFCARELMSVERQGRSVIEKHYVDVLRILEIYEEENEEAYILGITYDKASRKFSARSEMFEAMFRGAKNSIEIDPPSTPFDFQIDTRDTVYQLPQVYIEDFGDKEVPNKKQIINTPTLLNYLGAAKITDVPIAVQDWLVKAAKIYSFLADTKGVKKGDLITVLNALSTAKFLNTPPEELGSVDKQQMDLSDSFSEPVNGNETSDATTSSTKIELDKKSISEGYRVQGTDGRLVAYLDKETGMFFSSQSIVKTLESRTLSIYEAIQFCAKHLERKPDLLKTLELFVVTLK